jgi:hypothetical protein
MSATAPDTLRLHRLTMVLEKDGVMIGRPETGSYGLFPTEGAEGLRLLANGASLADVAAWYEHQYGSSLDTDDFVSTLDGLGFLREEGEDEIEPATVRWQRLGKWAFSFPAWLCYIAVVSGALIAMTIDPDLRPSYNNVFFTDHISLIPLALTAAQIPCVLLHESFHALAGRRLGLPSTLGIGRRLYFLVAVTRLDSLLSVPRRQRYLPFLAGMLADTLIISSLTLLAAALRAHETAAWVPAFCLALAFTGVLRLFWQFMFYLETDLYYVAATALRCADLQNATRFYIRSQFRRLLRRVPLPPDTDWSDRDRLMARWYAPVLVSGYGFALASFVWAGIPTTVRFWSTLAERFGGSQSSTTAALLDALVFLSLTAMNVTLLIYVAQRDRSAQRRARQTSTEGAVE